MNVNKFTCKRNEKNSCEITLKKCGKNFSSVTQFFILQSSPKVRKFSIIFKKSKRKHFFFNFYKNGIIILILTQNDHRRCFFIITPFFRGFQKKVMSYDFLWFSEKLRKKFFRELSRWNRCKTSILHD